MILTYCYVKIHSVTVPLTRIQHPTHDNINIFVPFGNYSQKSRLCIKFNMAHMNNVQYKGRKMFMKSYFKLANRLEFPFHVTKICQLLYVFYESLLAQDF